MKTTVMSLCEISVMLEHHRDVRESLDVPYAKYWYSRRNLTVKATDTRTVVSLEKVRFF